MDPNQLGQYADQIFSSQVLGKFVIYTGWTLLAVIILAFFVVIYYYFQFKYKVTYCQLLYDSDGNSAQVVRFKKDRARVVKKKDGTRWTHFLYCRKKTEPLRPEDIKPGNKVHLLSINDDNTYTALPSFSLDHDGKPHQFESLPPELKTWAILEIKESALANQDEAQQKRLLVFMLIGLALVGAIMLVGIWLTLKYTGNVTDALKGATPALQNIAEGLSGKAPV